jgi:hypothetical protein
LSAAALTATEASARLDPDPGSGHTSPYTTQQCNYPNHPVCEVVPVDGTFAPSPSDDNKAEALQAGASALGGAGLAFGGIWLYRRRHALAI